MQEINNDTSPNAIFYSSFCYDDPIIHCDVNHCMVFLIAGEVMLQCESGNLEHTNRGTEHCRFKS